MLFYNMTIIYASNIHQGGGKVLLETLLKAVKSPHIFFSDARLELSFTLSENIVRVNVRPSIWCRFLAEYRLWKQVRLGQKVLCFGNLPPLFPCKGVVALYFQNTILLKKYADFRFSWKTRLKHKIERSWLRWGLRSVQTVYVQSRVVRDEFLLDFPTANVVVAPFMENILVPEKPSRVDFDFVYVGSGDPHKNHHRLLEAWKLLAEDGIYPSLALTLSQDYKELLSSISLLQSQGIKISNYPNLSHAQVLELYARSKALVFPSLTESFGLPLLEANAIGLPIIASELDFVREFVSPVQSFDPLSSKSISHAVKRFLNSKTSAPQRIYTAEEFLGMLD